MEHIKKLFVRIKEFVSELAVKNRPALRENGAFGAVIKNNLKTIIISSSAVLVALALLLIGLFAFSTVNVSVTMPKQVYTAAEMTKLASEISGTDVSYSDIFRGNGAVSPSDTSDSDVKETDSKTAMFEYYLFMIPSASDVSYSDVSGSDISGTDASAQNDDVTVELKMKKKATVADVLNEIGIPNSEYLYISNQPDEKVSKNMKISVSLLVKVRITVDGETFDKVTDLNTVAEILSDSDVSLGADDRISCELTGKLYQDMNIVIRRVEVKEENRTEEIPFKTVTEENSKKLKGEKEVITEGQNGEKTLTFRLTFVDGMLESEELIGEEITIAAVDKVVEIGTKTTTAATTKKTTAAGKRIVSKEKVYDCDGSGHGYYVITYSDGSVVYKDF